MRVNAVLTWLVLTALGIAVWWLWSENFQRRAETMDVLQRVRLAEERQRAVASRDKAQAAVRYFPEGAFNPDPFRDARLADVWGNALRAMAAPAFLSWIRERRRVESIWRDPHYRLLRMTVEGPDLFAHVYYETTLDSERKIIKERRDDHLVVQVDDPRKSFDENRARASIPVQFQDAERDRFEAIVKELDFWEMPSSAPRGPGGRLLLEGVDGDRYHVVVRASDSSKGLADLFSLVEMVAARSPVARPKHSASIQGY